MLEDLDTIPWSQLTHAYGSAEDVPGLLRELRTPAPGKEEEKEPDPSKEEDEEAPLWCLFGNIWHQGTVYEAMAYAVPFLLELVSDSQTPERTGILQLLASIAKSKFTTANVREPGWAVKAHAAVAAGFAVLAAIAKEETEVRLAAAHVLAFLPEQAEVVEPLLQDLLHAESGPAERAGFLLLLGQLGGKSDAALAMLTSALQSADLSQRWAAAYSMALLRPQPLSDFAREAIVEAILAEDFEENFRELPWDAPGDIDCEELYACLDASSREQAATACIGKIESGKATHATISIILGLLFPMTRAGGSSRLKAGDHPFKSTRFERWPAPWKAESVFSVGPFLSGACPTPGANGVTWLPAGIRRRWI